MDELSEVVVDRKVLNAFKRRAMKAYPREILEQVIGRCVGTQARIFAFRDLEHQASRGKVFVDEDLNPMAEGADEHGLEVLGTIHTHPQETIRPSDLDWESMKTDGELVMGICAIRKTARRRFVSFGFFNSAHIQLQLTISEDERKAAAARA